MFGRIAQYPGQGYLLLLSAREVEGLTVAQVLYVQQG